MIDINCVINLNEACKRAYNKAAASFVVNLGNLLLNGVSLSWHRPHPSVRLEHLEFKSWVDDEDHDF